MTYVEELEQLDALTFLRLRVQPSCWRYGKNKKGGAFSHSDEGRKKNNGKRMWKRDSKNSKSSSTSTKTKLT